MIRKILVSMAAVVAASASAFAADLPARRAPPVYVPPVPAFTYTGLYAGLDLGYAFGTDNAVETIPAAGLAFAFPVGRPNGITGGAHIGYNFSTQSIPVFGQFASAISGVPLIGGVGGSGGVIGVEGDVKGSDFRSVTNGLGGNGALPVGETDRSTVQGTVRGRVGVAVDRALFFATGGAAFATFNNTYQNVVAGNFATSSTTRVGYVVGGGVEYALTTNISIRAQYLYEDYGRYTQVPTFGAAGAPFTFTHREIIELGTVGFSYKFDNPVAPVVARY